MNFKKLITKRQSCRDFSDKKVDKKLLLKIVEEATFSPSACNSQPWRVVLTSSTTENAKIKSCLQDDGKNKFLDNAQAFVAVYENYEVSLKADVASKFPKDHFVKYDIGEFVAYLTLSAKNHGLDSCIIGWVNNEKLNSTFNIDGTCSIVVALGYANSKEIRKKKRYGLDKIILQ